MPDTPGNARRIAIVGAGLMGLALAERLSSAGHEVHVYERDTQIGGLATWHDYGDFDWDRFYHVILPTDVHLVRFIKQIGLGEQLRWRETQTGFYVDGNFHSLNNSIDFLRFPPLSLWGKMRLAFTLLYGSRIDDWQRLEQVGVEEWLLKVSGRATYEKMWKPLLLAKLGENYKRVSAVFIWSYIKRLFTARDSSAHKEHMGYVSGGYKSVFERVAQRIGGNGGRIHCGSQVERVASDPAGGITIAHDGRQDRFDKVVFTSPVNVLRQVVDTELVEVANPGSDVEYLGVVCMVLVTREPLTPYYVLNIAEPRIPFTGVIGMSTVVGSEETAGQYLTYFPKYVLSDDALLRADDADLRAMFLDGMRRLYPRFPEASILGVHINRAFKVQPLQVRNYSQMVPRCAARHPDFFVLNTSQFVNNTLNNNEVIKYVDNFMDAYGGQFGVAGANAGGEDCSPGSLSLRTGT